MQEQQSSFLSSAKGTGSGVQWITTTQGVLLGALDILTGRGTESGKQAPQATSCQRHDDRDPPNG
jgi:hypothetical protein